MCIFLVNTCAFCIELNIKITQVWTQTYDLPAPGNDLCEIMFSENSIIYVGDLVLLASYVFDPA